jgi:hypothetical protein
MGVHGESHYQDALRRVAAKVATRTAPTDLALTSTAGLDGVLWFDAVLIPEHHNPHDANAIAVYAAGGGKVGYIPREKAADYRPVFDLILVEGYKAGTCPAFLTGGTDGKFFGVMLALPGPNVCIKRLRAPAP